MNTTDVVESDRCAENIPGEETFSTGDLFSYLDYREFLRDFYVYKKATSHISYRGLARRIGVKSGSYVKHVMDGDRNLSEEMAFRFAAGLRLSGLACQYFVDLVHFNQAHSPEIQLSAARRLEAIRESLAAIRPPADQNTSRWTLKVAKTHLTEVERLMQNFRGELYAIAQPDETSCDVVELTVQMQG